MINIPNIIGGAFISTYVQNKKFRDEVNKSIKQLSGYMIDIINGERKEFNTAQNKGIRGDADDVYIDTGESDETNE